MPFTFSHPAAVLPLYYLPKRFISMTGLIVGSMVPDFEYFMRLNGDSHYSHTWPGIFYFDLPLSIILAFLFHGIVRNVITDNLPKFVAAKLVAFKNFDWAAHFRKNYIVILISMIVGAASHLLTDDFTHAHTLFVDMFSILRKHVHIGSIHMPLFIFLQFLGTIVGLLIVTYAVLQLPSKKNYRPAHSFLPYWIYVSIIMILVAVMKYYFGNFPKRFDDRIVILVSGWLCGILVVSLFYKYSRPERSLVIVK